MSEESPKISVLMPFYNAADYLDASLSSIINQTFADWELILINDASTDNSDSVVQRYLSDPRIIYFKNEVNRGIVENLNFGLRQARSEIVARMDGDDISDLTRLAKQYDFLANHPSVVAVGTFIQIIDQSGKIIDQRTKPLDFNLMKKNLLTYSPLVHATLMFRKSAVVRVGGYRNQYLYCEDIDLFFRLVYFGYELANLPEFLYQYRYHQNSAAHQSRLITSRLYQLRQETIKNFNLHLTWSQRLMIFGQYLVGLILSGRQRQWLEGRYKKIFYHEK